MALKLIYGRAGSGKSTYCLKMMKEILVNQSDENVFLVVPEQFTLQAERELIKILGTGGILKNEVLSFKRMAHRVFSDVGGISNPHINQAGKNIILSQIIENNKEKIVYFNNLLEHNGFITEISSLLKEFKRYNITPNLLFEYKDKVDFGNKIEEIAILYQEFENALKDKYLDSDDDLTLLSKKMEYSSIFDNSYIFIDEFNGFTPQEYAVISGLISKAKEVNICLCTEPLQAFEETDWDIFQPVKNCASQLIKLAKENNTDVSDFVFLNDPIPHRFSKSVEIAFLEKNFFKYPNPIFEDITKEIELFISVNMYKEVENIAKEIIILCREKGYRFNEIAFLCRNLDTYEKIASVIFKNYEIPFFIDKKHPVTNHSLIKLLHGLFDIVTGNWSYEAVFGYLKTGLSNIATEDIDIIENYVLACGIKGSIWTMSADWKHTGALFGEDLSHEYTDEFFAKVNSIRRNIIQPILKFCGLIRGKKTAKEVSTALYEFMCELEIVDRVESRIEFLRANAEFAMANEYSQILEIVMEVLDQIVEVMGEKIVSVDSFSKLLSIAFSEYQIGSIPPSLDRVMVGSVDRTRSHNVRVLFVAGINDGVFPSASFEEGILSDNDRNILKDLGLKLAEDSVAKAFDEQFMIYRTFTTSSEKIKLSYPISDEQGKGIRPSIIVSRIRNMFPKLSKTNNFELTENSFDIEEVCGKTPTFNRLLNEFRSGIDNQKLNSEWLDVFNWYYKKSEWKDKCDIILNVLDYNNKPSVVSKSKVSKLYGNPLKSSISKIERYSSCPFSYFIQFGIKAKERKIFRFSAPDIGNFLHLIIERFSNDLTKEGHSWRTFEQQWANEKIKSVVEEVLQKMKNTAFGSSMRYISLTRRLIRVIKRIVFIIAEHIRRGKFDPLGYEMSFGEGGDFPPITIELAGKEKVYLSGRIDRVDALKREDGTYIRIVDYKSGNKKLNMEDIYHGLQIQLITYLGAITENGRKDLVDPILPGGIFYLRLDDPLVKCETQMTEQEIEKSIIKQLKMQGILLGDISLIRDMDTDIEGDSIIVPTRINKGDILGRGSYANKDRFLILQKYVKKLLTEISQDMMDGNVNIKPYKKEKDIPCVYCKYLSICQFDTKFGNDTFKTIEKKDSEEVYSMMQKRLDGELDTIK